MILQNLAQLHNMLEVSLFIRSESLCMFGLTKKVILHVLTSILEKVWTFK